MSMNKFLLLPCTKQENFKFMDMRLFSRFKMFPKLLKKKDKQNYNVITWLYRHNIHPGFIAIRCYLKSLKDGPEQREISACLLEKIKCYLDYFLDININKGIQQMHFNTTKERGRVTIFSIKNEKRMYFIKMKKHSLERLFVYRGATTQVCAGMHSCMIA